MPLSPRHHPSEDTLWSYAVGALTPGADLVVAAHLEACPLCAAEVRFLDMVGGGLLASGDGASVSAATRDRVMTAVDTARRPTARRPGDAPMNLPLALRGRKVGFWRWAGPGLSVAPVVGAAGTGERLYLLRAKPGVKLPRHSHSGAERVQVLHGAFVDGARYEAGDLCETARDHHEPAASADGPCLCLVATDSPLRFSGIARLLQPILGV